MKTSRASSFLKLVVALAVLGSSLAPALAKPKRLLVVTMTLGFRHSSIPTAEKIIAELGEKSGEYTVDFVRGGPNGKDDQEIKAKMTPEALKQYDGVIFANTTGDLPIPDREAFLNWLKSGKAFVGMHSCSDTYHGYPKFIEMLGGEFLTHKAQAQVECLNQDAHHAANVHLSGKWSVFDEIYILKNFHRDQVHGLLWLDKHPNDLVPGDYPISWCKDYGKGRVFYTSLGHREDVWDPDWKERDGKRANSPEVSRAYQQHILAGIKWALGKGKGDGKPQSTAVKLSPVEVAAGFRPLFNGVDLTGWKLRDAAGRASWSAQNGMLVNSVDKEHGTDLVSEEKFRDFTVRYEYLVPKGSNSGFYLRGRHEIQVLGDCGSTNPEPGSNGGIYSVKAPSQIATRPCTEWQEAEATIKGSRVTVTLNGVKVHDNVEVNRATGGELDNQLDQPGPILLQGDHGAVAFRNIRIKPLK